jgi:uncharacterized protein
MSRTLERKEEQSVAVIRKYTMGEFCWTDLGTTDIVRAKKFYQGVFGWKVRDASMGAGNGNYSLMRLDGKDVCGLYPMPPAPKRTKSRPSWRPYVAVKNASAAAKKAKSAGGKITMGPTTVMDRGRMATIQDPTGAGFAVWQAGSRQGVILEDRAGTVCWHDLNTSKPKAAAKFYAAVFGWKTQNKDIAGNEYHLFRLGDESVCGMWPWPAKQLPPSWVTYFEVADCAKSVAKANRLGGRIVMGPIAVPGMGHFAIIADPQGATFGIIGR